jgi:transposase
VSGALARAAGAKLRTIEAVEALSDAELERRLYGGSVAKDERRGRVVPDFAAVHAERRRPGVTLELLHLEYLEQHPDGYGYSRIAELYRRWVRRQRLTMRQIHRAGEKMFTDYAGKKPSIVNPVTGEIQEVGLFVAVLGASSFTYAEASRSQTVPDFLASHARALAEAPYLDRNIET